MDSNNMNVPYHVPAIGQIWSWSNVKDIVIEITLIMRVDNEYVFGILLFSANSESNMNEICLDGIKSMKPECGWKRLS